MASIRCGGEAVWKEQSSVGIYPKDKYRGEYDDAQLIVFQLNYVSGVYTLVMSSQTDSLPFL